MLFAISSLITTVANFIVGLFIYLRNPQRTPNRLFFLLTTTLSLWIATLYFYYQVTDLEWLLILGRVNFAFPTLTVYYLYKFVYEFPDQSVKLSKYLNWGIDIFSYLTTALVAFTPLIVLDESIIGTERIVSYGLLYPLWTIYFAILPIFALFLLALKIRRSSGTPKTQLRYFLAGTGIAYFFGFVTNVILPYVFSFYGLQPLGPIGTLFLSGLTAYAIVKHRFLDITLIVARVVSYTIVLSIVVLIEIVILWVGIRILPSSIDTTYIAFFGAVMIIMGYGAIRSKIDRLTDKIFFQGRYDTEVLLQSLIDIMVKEVMVDKLTRSLLTTLTNEMRVKTGAFVILREGSVRSVEFVGYPLDKIPFTDSDLKWLTSLSHETLAFEDLDSEEQKEYFRRNNLALIIPLAIKADPIGYLLLGPKSSGEVYLPRDFELLSIFAPQAAIAIKNAESLREIQEFNATLSGKVAERTRELEQSQAEQLKLKDEFVFIATHDLATPVTAISGFSEIIKKSKFDLPPALATDLSAIDEASKRLKVLVNDLLQVARSDAGTIKVELTPVNVKEIIEAAVRQASPMASEKKVTLTTNFAQDNTIQADPKKLAEVVENLISNGIKYNQDGGTLALTTKTQDKQLVIEFQDTGLGIDAKEQSKIFTKFFRSEEAVVRQRPGTGLGLFVVRMLVEKMGGTISFTSVKGKGSTFTLKFNR